MRTCFFPLSCSPLSGSEREVVKKKFVPSPHASVKQMPLCTYCLEAVLVAAEVFCLQSVSTVYLCLCSCRPVWLFTPHASVQRLKLFFKRLTTCSLWPRIYTALSDFAFAWATFAQADARYEPVVSVDRVTPVLVLLVEKQNIDKLSVTVKSILHAQTASLLLSSLTCLDCV